MTTHAAFAARRSVHSPSSSTALRTRAAVRRAWALLPLLIMGCGSGGGGGTGAVTGPTGIAEKYYPVGTGLRWAYEVSSPGTPSWLNETVITGTRSVGGASAWVFRDSNPDGEGTVTETFYTKDSRAYTLVGDNSVPSWAGTALGTLELMRFDGTFSDTPLLVRTGIDLGDDLDGDGRNETVDARVTGTVEGYETLTSELGTFASTAVVRYDIAATVRLSRGGTAPITITVKEWRAPDLGAVRQVTTATSSAAGGIAQRTTLELKGVSVNGIQGGVLTPTELLGSVAPASSDMSAPGRPAMASNASRHLLLAHSGTSGSAQWIARFIDPTGQPQETITLSPNLPFVSLGGGALSSDGNEFMAVTVDSSGLLAQRITATGGVRDPYPGIRLKANGNFPAMAWGAGMHAVAYREMGASVDTIRLALVSPTDGSIVADVEVGPARRGWADLPAIAFDGANFIVTWAWGTGDTATLDVYARRVTPAGVMVDATPITVADSPEAQQWPSVACDGTNCLITWVDRRNYPGQSYSFSPGPGDLYGRFIPRGSLVPGAPINTVFLIAGGIAANQGYPSLAFSGSDYLLAWSRGGFLNNPGGPTGIYAARIPLTGQMSPVDPGIALSGPPADASRLLFPVLSARAGGVQAAWVDNTEISGQSKRIMGTQVWPRLAR